MDILTIQQVFVKITFRYLYGYQMKGAFYMTPQTLLSLTLILLTISGGTSCKIMTDKAAVTVNPETIVEMIDNYGISAIQQNLEIVTD